ncbi:tocopherol cyclase [Artemisia annua]|uniref:Tocopherol cyclase n=1 Tax=Artemisia annua TaxID=35608 RepID=A0A2U1LND5_ARTAN|nr:tocopherol cyclase [Artemisia annua]
MAAVEVGGGPWFNTWKGKTYTPEIINRALNVPVDVDGILGLFPLFKPPARLSESLGALRLRSRKVDTRNCDERRDRKASEL